MITETESCLNVYHPSYDVDNVVKEVPLVTDVDFFKKRVGSSL